MFLKTREETKDWLHKNNITGYKINSDLTVDVFGHEDVDLRNKNLTYFPVKFGFCMPNFNCSGNQLTSLFGAPDKVLSNFNCSYNQLQTLEYCPKEIGGSFSCSYNHLETLMHGPTIIHENYNCSYNRLLSLYGAPQEIKRLFDCSNNQLVDLDFCPERCYSLDCSNNYLKSLEDFPITVGRHDFSNNKIIFINNEKIITEIRGTYFEYFRQKISGQQLLDLNLLDNRFKDLFSEMKYEIETVIRYQDEFKQFYKKKFIDIDQVIDYEKYDLSFLQDKPVKLKPINI